MGFDAVVIGVSAGGLQALRAIIPILPRSIGISIIIVQHMAADSSDYLSIMLDEISEIRVKEVDDKEEALPECAYIAPPNYHLLVENDRTFSLTVDESVNFSRPSIDVLFESAAYVYGERLIGVILTGKNSDGANGLKAIKEAGGYAIVQDPETAEYQEMPRAALQAVEANCILPLEEIADKLIKLCESDANTGLNDGHR